MKKIISFLIGVLCVGCTSLFRPYYIGGKYAFSDNRIEKRTLHNDDSTVIDLVVHSYNTTDDDKFIIAYQIPLDSIDRPLPTEYYWLIDVENDSIYGPLTLKAFMDTKRRLGVHLTFKKYIGSTSWCNELCHRVIEQDTCK